MFVIFKNVKCLRIILIFKHDIIILIQQTLPEWFIKLFTLENDTVLDPFMGSGTSLFVANRMKRNSIGIDIVPEYYEMVKKQLHPVELYLFEPIIEYEKNKSK